MRIVFMGTAEFALPSVQALVGSGHDLAAVFSQPDRRSGRGQKVKMTPVKELAVLNGLRVYQPESLKDTEVRELIRGLEPDLIVVIAYGRILPESILSIPTKGCVNVHGSLLPAYRGAAPIQRSIMAGDRVVGVTTMYMDRGMDTGDIILSDSLSLTGDEDYGMVASLLADQGAELLLKTLDLIEKDSAPRHPQDETRASYAPPLTGEDELIKWNEDSRAIRAQILGLSPVPGAYTWWQRSKLKIFRAEVVTGIEAGRAGEVVRIIPGRGFIVRTGLGGLLVLEVQKPGKKRIAAGDFLKGSLVALGDILGDGDWSE